MARPNMIRTNVIEPNRVALEQFGVLLAVKVKSSDSLGRGRPSTAFYLNEEQALYVTMHCRTDRAEAVKVEVVKVFTAWRRGPAGTLDATLKKTITSVSTNTHTELNRALAVCRGTLTPPDIERTS